MSAVPSVHASLRLRERALFVPLRPPEHEEVEALLACIVTRVLPCAERHFNGRGDDLAHDVMAVLAALMPRMGVSVAVRMMPVPKPPMPPMIAEPKETTMTSMSRFGERSIAG